MFYFKKRKSGLMFLPITGSFLLVEYEDLQNMVQIRSEQVKSVWNGNEKAKWFKKKGPNTIQNKWSAGSKHIRFYF